jgi:hypothetical protein
MSNTTIRASRVRAGDVIRDAYPLAVNAPVAQEDIAAVAARVILASGPDSLSRCEMVTLLGEGSALCPSSRRSRATRPPGTSTASPH